MTAVDRLRQDYLPAFYQYLARREEPALHRGYELGRTAVATRVSLLDIASVHHAALIEVLRQTPAEDLVTTASAASEFFLDVLAAYDMTQRHYLDGTGTGGSEL